MKNVRLPPPCLAIALAGSLLAPGVAEAQCRHGGCDRPYGDYCRGPRWRPYGAKQPVKSAQEARARLEEFYAEVDVVVGKITERNLHFEAEINDTDGDLVDRVIIDKRSGRIRSIL
jgi:hypothetical protein